MKQARSAIVHLGAAALLVFLLAIVWVFVVRERSTRRLYSEYEVFRALTAVTDMVRDPGAVMPRDERLLGFGLYRSDGTRLYGYGSTPEFLPVEILLDPTSARRFTASSVILVRPFGMESMRRPPQGWSRGSDRSALPEVPDSMGPGSMMMPLGGAARFAYIEYDMGNFRRDQAVLTAGAAFLSLALAGAFLLLVSMYQKNQRLQDREYANRELVQLGEAARTLAHEIKNPLGILRVQSALLKRTVGQGAEEGFNIIDEEIQRLGDLVDRIREFLKSGEGRPESLVLGDFLTIWARKYPNVRLEIQIPKDRVVKFDHRRLTNVLDNLTRNAVESMEGSTSPGIVEVRAQEKRGAVLVTVSDRGTGVDPADAHRLFEPFYSTKEKGTGIGLALCRKWAEAAGGKLYYKPREGGGSVFELRLIPEASAAQTAGRMLSD